MDFLQLKYFQLVAKYQHLTKAAQALNISQPALSKMISKLENDLGYELFERKGRKIALNKLGEAYLHTVENVFAELKNGEQALAILAEKQSQLITVAVTIPTILPELLGAFLEKHPKARFRQFQASSDHMKKQLESGEIDVGISTTPIVGDEIEWLPVLEEELMLTVPLNHPLAGRDGIRLIEVKDDPFIVMPYGFDFRRMTDAFCAEAGFSPNYAFEGVETGITQELVEKGLGVAFFPPLVTSKRVYDLQTAKLSIIEPKCSRSVGLVWHKRRSCPQIVQDFIAYTIQYLEGKRKS